MESLARCKSLPAGQILIRRTTMTAYELAIVIIGIVLMLTIALYDRRR